MKATVAFYRLSHSVTAVRRKVFIDVTSAPWFPFSLPSEQNARFSEWSLPRSKTDLEKPALV